MNLLSKLKEINKYLDKLHNNKVYIGDVIPNTWKKIGKAFLIFALIILGLVVFTIILSFFF
ncbi:MAG: hypothetical protein ACK5N8_05420 [Alphaproteobacteria bacterium]